MNFPKLLLEHISTVGNTVARLQSGIQEMLSPSNLPNDGKSCIEKQTQGKLISSTTLPELFPFFSLLLLFRVPLASPTGFSYITAEMAIYCYEVEVVMPAQHWLRFSISTWILSPCSTRIRKRNSERAFQFPRHANSNFSSTSTNNYFVQTRRETSPFAANVAV